MLARDQPAVAMSVTVRPRAPRELWRSARRNPGTALLVAAGAICIVIAVAQAPATIRQLYRDGDIAGGIVLPQLAGHLPAGTDIDLGNHSWYEAWWFDRATVGLPGHWVIWEIAPYLLAAAGIAAVAWSAWLALGRRAALYTAVVLLSIGTSMRQVMYEPADRVGIVLHMGLLCAALLIVWRHAGGAALRWRWLAGVSAGIILFTGAGVTDQLAVYYCVIPLGLAGVLCWWRIGTRQARVVAGFALVVAAGSLIVGALLSRLMEHEGVHASLGLSSFSFIPAQGLGSAIGNTLSEWTALGNGQFFGAAITRAAAVSAVLGGLCLVALFAELRLAYRSVGAWWTARTEQRAIGAEGPRTLFIAFFASALLISLASNTLTNVATSNNPRYLVGAWTAGAAMLGALVTSRAGRRLLTAGVALFALVISYQNVHDGVAPLGLAYPPRDLAPISAFVRSHGARIGYAGYPDAENLTWETRFRLQAFPIWPCPRRPGSLCARQFASISSWYRRRPGTRSFLITDAYGIPAAPASFGPALASTTIGRYTVKVYGHDLAANLQAY